MPSLWDNTYLVHADGNIGSFEDLDNIVQLIRLASSLEEVSLNRHHTLGWVLANDMIQEIYTISFRQC